MQSRPERRRMTAPFPALIKPTGGGGGLVARATSTDSGYSGIGFMLSADAAEARLLLFDGNGKAAELAPTVALSPMPANGYAVSLEVSGDKVSAKIGGRAVNAKLPADVAAGRAGIAVRSKGVDIRQLKITSKATP